MNSDSTLMFDLFMNNKERVLKIQFFSYHQVLYRYKNYYILESFIDMI